MSGRCIPERPLFLPAQKFRAEKIVWQALRRRLRESDVLLHAVRFVDRDGDWEADLVLLLPEGFCVIEVKGGRVSYADGQYWAQTPEGPKAIDLSEQALGEKYLLRRYLMNHRLWSRGQVRMVHLVALPDMELSATADFGPGLPRSQIIDSTQLRDIHMIALERLRVAVHNQPTRVPGGDGVDLAAQILGGVRDRAREVDDLRVARADHVAELGRQLHVLLDAVELWPRVQFIGGPGTGKTTLALEQTQRWARAGLRVGFIAFSRGLITWVGRQIDDWPADVAGRVSATTYHTLGSSWGVIAADAEDRAEWEYAVPRRMLAAANELAHEAKFDAIVVDEAQDFGAEWWPALLASLRDPSLGRIAAFGDAGQAIFRSPATIDLGPPPLVLKANMRNAEPIGNLVNAARNSAGLELRGGPGPVVRFESVSVEKAIHRADDEAVALLDAGWPPSEVALLTTGHRHGMHKELVDARGRSGYWESFWDSDDIFYATVAGFKGLERPAIVLAINGFLDHATARDILVVGMSRARDLLVVCGDPEMIRAVGGKELARRLLPR